MQGFSCGLLDQVFGEIGTSRKTLGCAVQSVQVLEKYSINHFGTVLITWRLKRQNLQRRPLLLGYNVWRRWIYLEGLTIVQNQ